MCPGERQVLVNLGEAGKVVNEARMKRGGGEEEGKEEKKRRKKKLEKEVLRPAGGRGSGCSAAPGRRLAAGGGIAPARCASRPRQGQAAQPGHHPPLRKGTTERDVGRPASWAALTVRRPVAPRVSSSPSQTEPRLPRASLLSACLLRVRHPPGRPSGVGEDRGVRTGAPWAEHPHFLSEPPSSPLCGGTVKAPVPQCRQQPRRAC